MATPDRALQALAESVLLTGFHGTTPPAWLLDRLGAGLGGVCLFSHNVVGASQVGELGAALREARADVLVASDEEGGEVTRLAAATGSPWPSAAALGRVDDVGLTRSVARHVGASARECGVGLVLGPVADVLSRPEGPAIGVRSFGASPDLVARHVGAAVRGLQEGGASTCVKHFPGHGATAVDSHLDLPVVEDPVDVLRARDLPPFAAAVRAGTDAVMTAHVRYAALDDLPATASRRVLDLLRRELGFSGVVVTDALDMGAIAGRFGRGPGAARALAAGADLVCIGNPAAPSRYDDRSALEEVRDAVVRAVRDGELDAGALEAASSRVHELRTTTAERRRRADGSSPADPRLGVAAARRALERSGDVRLDTSRGAAVVDLRGGAAGVADAGDPDGLAAALARLGVEARAVGAGTGGGGPHAWPSRDLKVVVLVDAPGRDAAQRDALAALVEHHPDALVVHTGVPLPSDPLPQRWVRTWSTGRGALDAVADLVVAGG